MVLRRGRFCVSPAVAFLFLALAAGHAQEAAPAVNPDFIAGVGLWRDEKYQEAVAKLQAATQADPKLEAAWYYLGVCQFDLGSYQDAATAFQKALELRPSRPETRLYIGQIYEKLGAWDQALAVYADEIRLRDGKDPQEVYNAIARTQLLAGRHREAVDEASRTLILDPNYVEALYTKGQAEDALGEHEKAIATFHKAKDILMKWSDLQTRLQRLTEEKRSDPNITEEKVAQEYGRAEQFATMLGLWPELNKALGKACLNALHFAEGRNAFRAAMDPQERGNPDDPDAATLIGFAQYREGMDLLYNRGVIFQATDAFEAGAQALADAVKKSPDYAPAHATLGLVYLTEAQSYGSDPSRGIVAHTLEEAETELKRAIELDGKFVEPMLTLARTYAGEQRFDEALQQVNQALRISPNRADLHAELALTYIGLEKYDQARDEALNALQLDRKNVAAHNAAGLAAYYTGQLGDAVEDFTKAIELDPTQHQSYTNLGLAFFEMRTWPRARAAFSQALKHLPEAAIANTAIQRSYLYYLVALTHSNTDAHDQAIASLNQALSLDPAYIDALRQIARDYLALKKFEAAARALRRALQQSPGATEDASILSQLGLVYEAAGQPHDALAAYSEAITKDPNNLEAQTGFTRLHSL